MKQGNGQRCTSNVRYEHVMSDDGGNAWIGRLYWTEWCYFWAFLDTFAPVSVHYLDFFLVLKAQLNFNS